MDQKNQYLDQNKVQNIDDNDDNYYSKINNNRFEEFLFGFGEGNNENCNENSGKIKMHSLVLLPNQNIHESMKQSFIYLLLYFS